MRVAHLIMTHKEPRQLERLLKRLMFPKFDLYIHVDKKINIEEFLYLTELPRVFFIENREKCNWGGFSFVRAITESVREILSKEGVCYEYINLLSAQDYPLKSNEYIYEFLKINNGTNFISFEEIEGSSWWNHAKSRYEKYHFTDVNLKGKYRIQKLVNRFLPKRNFPLAVKMYGSSDASWWMLTTDCLRLILTSLDKNKRLISFMRFTWGADEFLYPTLIMNSTMESTTVNNNYRYIQWTAGSANPDILSIDELDTIVNTKCLFARKFDYKVDSEILNAIDFSIKMGQKHRNSQLRN